MTCTPTRPRPPGRPRPERARSAVDPKDSMQQQHKRPAKDSATECKKQQRMWSAHQKLELLRYRATLTSQAHQSGAINAPAIIFFDNNAGNFQTGSVECTEGFPIRAVKVTDCLDHVKNKNNRTCTQAFVAEMQKETNSACKAHFQALHAICEEQGIDDYFDGMSGINEKHEELLNDKDVFVFDWDRTITQCEGFLFDAYSFDTYHAGLSHWLSDHGKPWTVTNNSEDHLMALCGGSQRYHWMIKAFRKLDPSKTYIVTNNELRGLILQMAKHLLAIPDNHVFSMWDASAAGCTNKMELIQKKIVPHHLAPLPPLESPPEALAVSRRRRRRQSGTSPSHPSAPAAPAAKRARKPAKRARRASAAKP